MYEEAEVRMIGHILGLIFLFLWFSSMPATASTWRCGQEIAKVGDSSAEVLLKCGEPTLREEAATMTRGSWRERLGERDRLGVGSLSRRGTYGETRVRVENWYYDRGMNDFIYKLTFIGGVLMNIRTLRYGGLMKPQEEKDLSPPAPPPKSETGGRSPSKGRIDILGSPVGAKVYLNEFYVGNIPCTIEEVDTGSYGLTVSLDGFKDWKERVNVRADATLWLTVNLERDSSVQEQPTCEDEAPSSKKLYKWTDERGRIHITDSPPPGQDRR
jgi:hypothetical protein